MYMENNRRAVQNRADADFLRRMLGGELNGNGCGNICGRDRAHVQSHQDSRGDCCEWMPHTHGRQMQARQEAPVRPEGGCCCQRPCDNTSCPTEIPAPALAMVYCPRQCWHKLLDPEIALAHGSLFEELILPFEGRQIGGKEGCPHRHM